VRDDEAFDATFEEGRALDEDAAVVYAQRARGQRRHPTAEVLEPHTAKSGIVAVGVTNEQIGQELLTGIRKP
jgi:hypothetical protein